MKKNLYKTLEIIFVGLEGTDIITASGDEVVGGSSGGTVVPPISNGGGYGGSDYN